MPEFTVGIKVELSVRASPIQGLGVFAEQVVEAGQVVEICPTVFIPDEVVDHLDRTPLAHYVYPWEGGNIAVLGYGMVYNHAVDPNCEYLTIPDERFGVGVQVYSARRRVEPGEELTVNYTGVPGNAAPLWFQSS